VKNKLKSNNGYITIELFDASSESLIKHLENDRQMQSKSAEI